MVASKPSSSTAETRTWTSRGVKGLRPTRRVERLSVVMRAMWSEGRSTPRRMRVAMARLTTRPVSPRLSGLCQRETVKIPSSFSRSMKIPQACSV